MTDSLDRMAVLAGAVVCVLIATPAAVVQSVLADDDAGTDQSAWVFLALAAIVVAYLVGGAVAGGRVPDAPFINGAAATLAAFVAIQAVGAVVRLVRGNGLSPVAIVFNALLAASIGALGAAYGARRATIAAERGSSD